MCLLLYIIQVLWSIFVNGRLDLDDIHAALRDIRIANAICIRQVRPAMDRHFKQRFDLPGLMDKNLFYSSRQVLHRFHRSVYSRI